MKFRYARYGKTLRPVIPIKLKNKNQEIGYHVLVDSGADICIFDAEVGRELGINIEKGPKMEVFGIGGKASIYYIHPITVEVGGWPYNIEVGFMQNVAGRVMQYGVVGQIGFFEFFKVKFDFQKEEIGLIQK